MTNPINFSALLDDALNQLADHGNTAHIRKAAKAEIKTRINAAAPAKPAPGARAAARKARKAADLDELLTKIARTHCVPELETLETRRAGHLDFHEVAVWGLKAALIAAYEAGKASR